MRYLGYFGLTGVRKGVYTSYTWTIWCLKVFVSYQAVSNSGSNGQPMLTPTNKGGIKARSR